MAKDKLKIPELDSYEQALKYAYGHGGRRYVEEKMTFAEYTAFLEEGKCVVREQGNLYRDMSEGMQGNTVVKVGNNREDTFSNIFVSLHPRFSYPVMHNHSYVEIIYVATGQCLHFVEDRSFGMKKGDMCILAPSSMHALSVTDEQTLVMNIMVNQEFFDSSFLSLLRGGSALVEFFNDIFYKRQYTCPYVIYPTGDDHYIADIVGRMYFEVKERPYAYERSLELLTQQLFIALIRSYELLAVVASPMETEFNDYVVSVLGYMSVNYNRATLAQTAEFFGYTPTHLGRKLKHYTGKSFKNILTEIQMERAKELLDEGRLSITEISQEVGCFDSSHFNKKFKTVYGITPREYKYKKEKEV